LIGDQSDCKVITSKNIGNLLIPLISILIFLIFYSWAIVNTIWEDRIWERAAQWLNIGVNPYQENFNRRISEISQEDGWVYGPLSLYILYPVYSLFGGDFLVKFSIGLSALFHLSSSIILSNVLKNKELIVKNLLFSLLILNPMLLVLGSQGDILDLGLIFFLSLLILFYRRNNELYLTIVFSLGLLWKQAFWFLLPVYLILIYKSNNLTRQIKIFTIIIFSFSLPFLLWNSIAYLFHFLGIASIFRELLVLPGNWWNFFQLSLKINLPLEIIQIISWIIIILFSVVIWYYNFVYKIPMELNIVWTIGVFALFYYSSFTLYLVWIVPFIMFIIFEHSSISVRMNDYQIISNS